jgi:predicted O-methyltransferase YrrM
MKEETNIQWWTSNVDYENLYQQCVQDLTALDLAGCCELVRAKAEDVVDRFGAESIGLLHIDGNHSQALSMKDATLYLPKVAPGGHIVFDDVSWMEKSMMTTQPALAYLLKHGCSEVDRTGDCAILRKRECIP